MHTNLARLLTDAAAEHGARPALKLDERVPASAVTVPAQDPFYTPCDRTIQAGAGTSTWEF